MRDTIIACALSQYGSLSNLHCVRVCVCEWGDANPIALFVCLRLMNFLCPACAAAVCRVHYLWWSSGELCMQEAPVISYLLPACTYFKPVHSD